jgi:hypothetical protein
LGERLLLAKFLKIIEVAQPLATFALSKSYAQSLTKNGLGFILGDFFHKLIRPP